VNRPRRPTARQGGTPTRPADFQFMRLVVAKAEDFFLETLKAGPGTEPCLQLTLKNSCCSIGVGKGVLRLNRTLLHS
jgi:hypothetical protein